MNPLAGMGIGLALGFAMAGAVYQARARREREVLARLVTQGEFRLLKRSGEAAAPEQLFLAVDAATGLAVTPEQRARRKWMVWGMLLASFVAAFAAILALRMHG